MANNRDKVAERKTKYPDPENTELIDYLRLLWQRRYIVLSGPLLFSLVAWGYCALTPKVYEIRAVVKPGVRAIDVDGSISYVDEPNNIIASIRSGEFNSKIFANLNSSTHNVPNSLNFDAKRVADSEVLGITYHTGDVDFGLKVVRGLVHALLQEYGNRVEYLRRNYDSEILVKETELSTLELRKQELAHRNKDLQTRIDQLRDDIAFLKESAPILLQQKNTSKSERNSDRETLNSLLYTYTYQQNLDLSKEYQKKLDDYSQEKAEGILQVQQIDSSTKLLSAEIKRLELKKNIMNNLVVLSEPAPRGHPVKPKVKQTVLVAGVVGFFLMIFFVFFLESINRYRKRIAR